MTWGYVLHTEKKNNICYQDRLFPSDTDWVNEFIPKMMKRSWYSLMPWSKVILIKLNQYFFLFRMESEP